MAAPPIAERHLPHFHRRAPFKEAVRVATTANITIATALNNGDTVDGVTLATGDRVLVKDQSTGSQNGIYSVSASPARDYDESTSDPAFGYLVYVVAGTVNGGSLWRNSNTSAPTIDTTALTFVQVVSLTPGTVTSVALTVPAELSVSGSPITTSGTLAVTKANQSANTVWAGPTSGSAAAPAFRALVVSDIPAGASQTDHEHVNNVQFNGDGATTAFELPAAPFDEQAVMAYVAGVRQDVTLSGTMLTTMTFGSAPASGTANIIVDVIAAVA